MTTRHTADIIFKLENTSRTLDEVIESVKDLKENIIKYASLYYTYYTLNFKGVKDFDYDLRTVENRLYEDFYYLWLFVIIEYISDCQNKYRGYDNEMYGFRVAFGKNEEYPYASEAVKFISEDEETLNEEVIDAIIKCTGCDPEFVLDIVKLNIEHDIKGERVVFANIPDLRGVDINYIEKEFGWISNSKRFLTQTRKFLNVEEGEPKDGVYTCYGFLDAAIYVPIIDHLLDRSNSKTLWVDTSWSFSHADENLFLEPIEPTDADIFEYDDTLFNLLKDISYGYYNNIFDIAKNYDKRLNRYLYESLLVSKYINEDSIGFHRLEEKAKIFEKFYNELEKVITTFISENKKVKVGTINIDDILRDIEDLTAGERYIFIRGLRWYLKRKGINTEISRDIITFYNNE